MDAINVLNHPVFGVPSAVGAAAGVDTNINSLTFGRITTASAPRQLVTGLRLNF